MGACACLIAELILRPWLPYAHLSRIQLIGVYVRLPWSRLICNNEGIRCISLARQSGVAKRLLRHVFQHDSDVYYFLGFCFDSTSATETKQLERAGLKASEEASGRRGSVNAGASSRKHKAELGPGSILLAGIGRQQWVVVNVMRPWPAKENMPAAHPTMKCTTWKCMPQQKKGAYNLHNLRP